MRHMLVIEHASKRFGDIIAVDDITLSIDRGEIVALLGPNGAGKTTLTRMVLGIFRPDSGKVTHYITGAASDDAPRWLVGYLPEERGLYPDMGILSTLAYFGSLHGLDRKAAERSTMSWLERFGLADRAKEPVKALSKGNPHESRA